MKILHTADWHLGQKFLYRDRIQEHQAALDWLLSLIREEEIELLLVAGDIFDIGNPPNYARRMYYQFLTQLLNTGCRHVVVVGGNHDSPAMLEAPKDLLEALRVQVVGAASEQSERDVLLLKDANDQLEAVVAAVPFLRDRDLRSSLSGEKAEDRVQQIQAGIARHYQSLAEVCQTYTKPNVPIITTGHLYAKGATAADKQDNIYIGNMENIAAADFPSLFDYVALGHLHRPQAVGQSYHIRYSGSLIPLSFSETTDQKSVSIVEFSGRKMTRGVREVPIPVFRQLRTITGDLESVQKQLTTLSKQLSDNDLTPWIEVIIETDQMIPNLDLVLKDYLSDAPLELLKIRAKRQHYALDTQTELTDLDDLSPLEVFRKKCNSFGSPPEEMDELEATFRELQDWMQQAETD